MIISKKIKKNLFLLGIGVFLYSCSSGDDDSVIQPEFKSITTTTITSDGATIGGEITYSGAETVTESGICYKTSANPTTADSNVNNTSPTGVFATTLTGLTDNTSYHARIFAVIGTTTYYSDDITLTTLSAPVYQIGDIGPGGGFIFYLNAAGTHGMEITPLSKQFQSQWGCYTTSVGATSAATGTGQANSNTILAYHTSINFYANPAQCQEVVLSTGAVAAKNCDNLVFNGYDDWYMPSIGDLQLVYTNLHSNGLGDFQPTAILSSSTQSPTYVRKSMILDFQYGTTWALQKEDLTKHRAIRNF